MDKRSYSSAAEDVCGTSEGEAGSTHGLTASASSVISDHPPRTPYTLGAFFRASRPDKQRARDGRYHNFERKTYSLKGSRTGQLWDRCRRPGMIAQDLFVCFGLPFIAFLPLFFASAEDRSYEVQPGWGGCRISTGSRHADESRVLVLQVLITAMTFSGFLFACFAIQCFRRCSGLENTFKLDDLHSPALKAPHQCDSTRTWVEWMKSASRRCFPSVAKDLQEMDDGEEILGRRSSNSAALISQQQQVRTSAHARESEFDGDEGDITACGSSR
ncbi:hypothetical protein BGZ68_005071 [Mortierella alpina]|nr:hypothetical protein BGZ68_005071 [Mortierella alpina]